MHDGGDLHGAGSLLNATSTVIERGAVIDASLPKEKGESRQAYTESIWKGGPFVRNIVAHGEHDVCAGLRRSGGIACQTIELT